MPRKAGSPPRGTNIIFREEEAVKNRLTKTALDLGIDMTGLLRLMIREHLPTYENRAKEISKYFGERK